jgi:uncharacterized membrane protein YccF (DUF307 family)
MPLLTVILNVLWLVSGGLAMAGAWLVAGIFMAMTVIGLPWAFAAFRIAWLTLLPFGQGAMRRDLYRRRDDLGTGPLGILGNIIWLLLGGWWVALGHLGTAVGLAVTIIGLPFAWAHLKLAGLALWPIGREIVPYDGQSGWAGNRP